MDLISPVRRIVGTADEVARLRQRVAELERELAQERQEKERERYAARHDPLTGLPNRLWLAEQAAPLLVRPRPVVAVLDLDGFKAVNDYWGHAVGDAVLIAIAARLTQLDHRWMVARLGGDEFGAIRESPVDDADLLKDAAAMAEVVASPMWVEGHEIRVSCSIGLAIGHPPAELRVLLKCADLALYRSKSSAGRPVLWQPPRGENDVLGADDRPAVPARNLRRARFGGMSVLVAADAGSPDFAVGRAPAPLAGAA